MYCDWSRTTSTASMKSWNIAEMQPNQQVAGYTHGIPRVQTRSHLSGCARSQAVHVDAQPRRQSLAGPPLRTSRCRGIASSGGGENRLRLLARLCRGGEPAYRIKEFSSECIGYERASFEVPVKSFPRLRLRQNLQVEGIHREFRRCRTSAQGATCTWPARSSARRLLTSARQRSEIVVSSALSRLSSNATARAERSSAGRLRTSSSRWSTRAFMKASLALANSRVEGPRDDMSIDTDTHLLRLRRAGSRRSPSRYSPLSSRRPIRTARRTCLACLGQVEYVDVGLCQ